MKAQAKEEKLRRQIERSKLAREKQLREEVGLQGREGYAPPSGGEGEGSSRTEAGSVPGGSQAGQVTETSSSSHMVTVS